jgi:hypothetical protein
LDDLTSCATASFGNTCFLSHSPADGARTSSANFRHMSYTILCSSGSAKWEVYSRAAALETARRPIVLNMLLIERNGAVSWMKGDPTKVPVESELCERVGRRTNQKNGINDAHDTMHETNYPFGDVHRLAQHWSVFGNPFLGGDWPQWRSPLSSRHCRLH